MFPCLPLPQAFGAAFLHGSNPFGPDAGDIDAQQIGNKKTSPFATCKKGWRHADNLSLTVLHETRANVASPLYAGDAANGSEYPWRRTWSTLRRLYTKSGQVSNLQVLHVPVSFVLEMTMPRVNDYKPLPAQLIFNPSAGDATASQGQLQLLLDTLRALDVHADVYWVQPNSRVPAVAARAARQRIPYVIVAGGDGTVASAARGLVGSGAALVVIPTGTRNNIARRLSIPLDLRQAAELIRTGTRARVDLGRVKLLGRETYFVEVATIGLSAALFAPADDVMHGNLTRLGDLLATFVTHPPAQFHLNLDRGRLKITVEAYLLVVMNMPFLGANYQLTPEANPMDGLLDVFLYADLNKLDLVNYAVQLTRGAVEDERVRHLRVKQFTVATEPPMPVMLDGQVLQSRILKQRTLKIRAYPRGLTILTPRESPELAQSQVDRTILDLGAP